MTAFGSRLKTLPTFRAMTAPRLPWRRGDEELTAADFVNRLLNGEGPLRVYRDQRGLTQAGLAERTGVNRITVAEIETDRKKGSVATLRSLAGALGVALDDLAE
jgi:DNA-binding XRE family transcriptional regulator